jgi:hypothetical protein
MVPERDSFFLTQELSAVPLGLDLSRGLSNVSNAREL